MVRLLAVGAAFWAAFAGCATGDDDVAADAGTAQEGGRDGGPTSMDATPEDIDAGGCRGCLTQTGVCFAGNQASACGRGGVACAACEGAESCEDGECATAAGTCTATSCDGCCVGDRCELGTAPSACGSGGKACETCDGSESCNGGRCEAACGADTCEGCCSTMGACESGLVDAACGSGGGACVACTEGEGCGMGVCVATSCADTCEGCCEGQMCRAGNVLEACGGGGAACSACAMGLACDAGVCRPAPTSRWNLHVVRAELPATNTTGDAWDAFGGLPDPWIEVVATAADGSAAMGMTTTISDTLTPAYSETVLRDVPASWLAHELRFRVWDSDLTGQQYVTGCFLGLPDAAYSGGLRVVTCARDEMGGQAGAAIYYRLFNSP